MPGVVTSLAAGAGTLALITGGLLYSASWPTSQVFGRTLIAGRDPREIALTFDDGPNDAATPELLEVLAKHGVRATFFIIGNYARQRPHLVREVAAAGHLIGNHTMSHPKLSYQPARRIRQELGDCKATLESITGAAVQFFRPPFGARRPYVLRTARELGLVPVTWNVTAYDWNPIGADRILANLNAGISRNKRDGSGSNLLLHDGSHRGMSWQRLDTVRAVDRLLAQYATDPNTRFVAVDGWSERR